LLAGWDGRQAQNRTPFSFSFDKKAAAPRGPGADGEQDVPPDAGGAPSSEATKEDARESDAEAEVHTPREAETGPGSSPPGTGGATIAPDGDNGTEETRRALSEADEAGWSTANLPVRAHLYTVPPDARLPRSPCAASALPPCPQTVEPC